MNAFDSWQMDVDPLNSHNDDGAEDLQDKTPDSSTPGVFYDYHQKKSRIFRQGDNLFDVFDADKQSENCKENLYYLYNSRADWELAYWLLESGLSMAKINSFLSLEFVCLAHDVVLIY